MSEMTKISLAAARVNAGMTQKSVAEALGVTANTVCRWENGKSSIPGVALYKLCQLYSVSMGDISLPRC